MTVSFVQNRCFDASPSTSPACTFLSNVTAGNLLLVYCWQGHDSTDDTNTWTVTDTRGNTYTRFAHSSETQFNPSASTGSKHALFATISGSSGANTITVGFGASKHYARMVIWEYSGAATPVASAVTSAADSAAHFALPLAYFYQTATTASDPGSQNLKLNNATLSSVTAAYFDSLSVSSQNRDAFFGTVPGSGAKLRFFDNNNLDNWVDYNVTSVTNNTGWWTVGLSYIGVNGTIPQTGGSAWWAIFNWGTDTVAPAVTTIAGGRVGCAMQNLNGSGGSTPLLVPYFYQTSTTASDPGSQNMRLDNANPLLATKVYADSVDANSTNEDTAYTSTLLLTDVLRIYNSADPRQYVIYPITAKTNNTGWWTFTLGTLIQSGETLDTTAGAAWYMNFTRQGSYGYAAATGYENFRQTTPDGYLGTNDKAAVGGSETPAIANKNFSASSTSQYPTGQNFGISWAINPASTVLASDTPIGFLGRGAGW